MTRRNDPGYITVNPELLLLIPKRRTWFHAKVGLRGCMLSIYFNTVWSSLSQFPFFVSACLVLQNLHKITSHSLKCGQLHFRSLRSWKKAEVDFFQAMTCQLFFGDSTELSSKICWFVGLNRQVTARVSSDLDPWKPRRTDKGEHYGDDRSEVVIFTYFLHFLR